MRVIGTSQAAQTRSKRPARRSGGAGGSFEVARGRGQRRASSLRGPVALANADTIMAVQMVDDADQRKRKTVDRGNEMLDLLDELKVGLLAGRVSEHSLKRLKLTVAKKDLSAGDRHLEDLMKQIDLRARVELAKIAKSSE
jgi:hypothetical protein